MKQFIPFIYVLIFLGLSSVVSAQDLVIVHTVEEGQTLYSIAKAYGVTPTYIQENNPLIDESYTIKPGQILRIKLVDEKQIHPLLQNMTKRPVLHQVKAKETLYGIAKGYQVDLEKIKEWNQLSESRLSIGQELIVGWRYQNQIAQSVDKPLPINNQVETAPSIESTPPQTITTPPSSYEDAPAVQITDKQNLLRQRFDADTAGVNTVTKAGPSIWFSTENQSMNDRYYALFSDAPIGSVIRVRNLINHHVVYVKVIGSLPNTAENYGAMMKMTPAAKHSLGIVDAKMRVEVTYLPKGE